MPERFIKVAPYVENSKVNWTVSVDGGPPGKPGNYPVAHALKGKNWEFTVTIDNPDGSNWHFTNDPLWVSDTGSDPTGPSQVPSEIHPNSIKRLNDTQIIFKDNNKKAGDLHYTLNFTDGGNRASTLDPIIQNGGGGGGGNVFAWFQSHPLETGIGALLLLGLLAALLRGRAARDPVGGTIATGAGAD